MSNSKTTDTSMHVVEQNDSMNAIAKVNGVQAMASVNGVKVEVSNKEVSANITVNRKLFVLNIENLISALQDNLVATEQKRNRTPLLDLKLHDDKELLEEVRKLVTALNDIKAILENGLPSNQSNTPIRVDALREFALKFSGSLGEGLGKTLSYGTRLALLVPLFNILNYSGFPIDSLIECLDKKAP